MQRYAGKPFLRLLESYVLWAAGELTPKDELKLVALTPKLRELYNRQGSWQEIIACEMQLPPDLPAHIKSVWSENKRRAENSGAQLAPEDFARLFVDDNLSNQ
jgi:hypothetical protein